MKAQICQLAKHVLGDVGVQNKLTKARDRIFIRVSGNCCATTGATGR